MDCSSGNESSVSLLSNAASLAINGEVFAMVQHETSERETQIFRTELLPKIKNGSYYLLEDYSYRARSIYPFKTNREENPSISVTYFCVPQRLAEKLGLKSS